MRLDRTAGVCLALVLVSATMAGVPAGVVAHDRNLSEDEVARLAAVARLWTTVRYAHPYLPVKEIDWDAALITALPRIRSASDPRAYADAVAGMLAVLKDPATRLQERREPSQAPTSAVPLDRTPHPHVETRNGVVVLQMTNYQDLAEFSRVMTGAQQQFPILRDAPSVVVDLRQRTPGPGRFVIEWFFRTLAPAMTAEGVAPPAVRTVMHFGYAPQSGGSSGGYYSALQLTMPEVIQPAPKVAAKRVAFVVNQESAIPAVALALQQSGTGILVSEGAIDDTAVAPSMSVNMGEGITAIVRTGEVVQADRGGLRADVTVPVPARGNDAADPAMAAAIAFVTGGARPNAAALPAAGPAPVPVWRPDAAYPDMEYPAVEYRLLGVYRLWGIVNYFFPYKHLMSRDWDHALVEFIPKVIAAKDALEYGQVIAEMATWLEDSHVGVDSSALRKFYGEAGPPLGFRYVENVPIVTALIAETAAQTAGIEIGDVLVNVDGEPVESRAARLERYLTVSNPWAAKVKLARYLAAGADGSEAQLTLRGADGRLKEIRLPRKASFMFARPPAAAEPSYRLIASDIGYVDLTRLEPREVDPMVDSFLKTKAIIFDMRGYPRGVFMALGTRLNKRGEKYAATFLRPILSAGSAGTKLTFQQGIPSSEKPVYRGQTIMLIDERAISQSEHTGLFLEQASDVRFIGSRTAGANGDVTRMVLPGRVMVGFTGHDVRHADGRQLQKVGLTPHVEVFPTIKGIQDGRDEVLDRAIRFVKEGA